MTVIEEEEHQEDTTTTITLNSREKAKEHVQQLQRLQAEVMHTYIIFSIVQFRHMCICVFVYLHSCV